MADIDQILAGGANASTRADFSGLPKILDNYWAGLDQGAKNELRSALRNIPPTPNGELNYPLIAQTLLRGGDVGNAAAFSGLGAAQQERQDYLGLPPTGQPQRSSFDPNRIPPSAGRSASVQDAPSRLQQGSQSQAGPGPVATGPNSIVGIVGGLGIPDELAGPIIQQVSAMGKLDPNAPINDPATLARVTQVAQAAVARQGGQSQPAQAPQQVAQAPQPQQPVPLPPMQQMSPEDAQALRKAAYFSASPNKAIAASAEADKKAILEKYAPTNEMKNATASGLTLPAYQEKQGELAAQQAGSTEAAKGDVAEARAYIDNGRVAQTRLGTLNAMQNILNTSKNLDLGFGSEASLKIKMVLERAGFDTGDLSGAQLIQKFGAALASESTKALATRPTQFEFRTFLANNPGLALDEKGNIRMIGIMAQNAKREYELGKLARKTTAAGNWDNWDNVVEKFDRENPIKDPTTGKVLSNNSIIAPGKQQQATPSIGEGSTAFNPTTKERIKYQGGKWVPYI